MADTAHQPSLGGLPAGRASTDQAAHRVAVLAGDSVVSYEFATAVHVFRTADTPTGAARYEVGVIGPERPVATTSAMPDDRPIFSVLPEHPLEWATAADTLVVPGHSSFVDVVPDEVETLIKEAAGRGVRLVALGLGAFALAAAGALDGRDATTHWRWTRQFALRHPGTTIRSGDLFVSDGPVHTAAGAASATDLILYLVEQDHGAVVASRLARRLVAAPRRDGGQAQCLTHDVPSDEDPIPVAMRWAEHHLGDDLSVSDLAGHVHMSARNFSRRFRAATGATPLDWLLRVRVRRAQHLLETTAWSVGRVAHESGFGSPVTFRHHFARVTNTTPGRYRRRHARSA